MSMAHCVRGFGSRDAAWMDVIGVYGPAWYPMVSLVGLSSQ